MRTGDLIGRKIIKIKTEREAGTKRDYIASIKVEGDASIVFTPHLNQVGQYVSYFEIQGNIRKPKTWARKLISKALFMIKTKIETYEKKIMDIEDFEDYVSDDSSDVEYLY